jgi:anti-anti-sigma factor
MNKRSAALPEDFNIANETTHGKTVLLKLSGRLDARSAPSLMERCGAVRAQGKNLVLNLASVSFVASSGIGALLALAEQFKDSAGTLRIAAPSTPVTSVIKLLNLDQFLNIDASDDQSLAAFEN